STTVPGPGGSWLEPAPSPSPWTVTTPGKWEPQQSCGSWDCPTTGPLGAIQGRGDVGGRLLSLEDALWRRTGSVSSGAIQPAWVPFGSTIAHQRRLRFALDAYDSSWSSRLPQPLTYSLGELINVEASVSTHPPLPLRVFVEECVASPSTAEQPRYDVITDGG
ncbi:ZP3 protein, partial [Bucorvus abyssinicus]|nr:ZP3 protein [Bucorvus abyssinicus]